ncbi:MAG: RHS repeat domain-containing protein [Pirellula sp.]
MSIHSHLPYDQSTSHARIPAGGINLIASIDSASEAQVTASFFGSTKALHGEVAIPSAETSTHNHSNQQYSITAITTSAGAVAERYAYSAYGEPTILDGSGSVIASSAINNRYSYTGREWDATVGLYHFRARWMSPKTGRFITKDPIKYKGSPYNLYELFGGESLNSLDYSGKAGCKCGEIVACNVSCGPWVCIGGRIHVGNAFDAAGNSGLPGPHNGPQDAFRHCVWNCEMAKDMGGSDAKCVADVHEDCGSNPPGEVCMDLFNNGKGREAARDSRSCSVSCMELLQRGELQTSDRCPMGADAGVPTPLPPLPEVDPPTPII